MRIRIPTRGQGLRCASFERKRCQERRVGWGTQGRRWRRGTLRDAQMRSEGRGDGVATPEALSDSTVGYSTSAHIRGVRGSYGEDLREGCHRREGMLRSHEGKRWRRTRVLLRGFYKVRRRRREMILREDSGRERCPKMREATVCFSTMDPTGRIPTGEECGRSYEEIGILRERTPEAREGPTRGNDGSVTESYREDFYEGDNVEEEGSYAEDSYGRGAAVVCKGPTST
jgi:hypothetical protein